jgi:hypothetical protein
MATLQPSFANARAAAAPMPVDAPGDEHHFAFEIRDHAFLLCCIFRMGGGSHPGAARGRRGATGGDGRRSARMASGRGKALAVGERDPPRTARAGERYRDDQPAVVPRRQRVVRQHGNAEPGRHHVPHGLERRRAHDVRLGARELRTGVEHLIAEAVADVEQDRVLRRELVRTDRFPARPLVTGRHDHAKRLLVQEFGDDAGGENGNARIATSIRPERSAVSRFSVRFSSRSSGICGAQALSAGDQVGQQIGGDRVDHAELEHAFQLVASRLRELANPRRFLEHLLRLLDHARTDGA